MLEGPPEDGVYAEEDGKVDPDNDEREDLATVVDEVEAIEGVGCKDTGGKEHSGKKYAKNTRGDLNPPRGANHQHMGKSNEHTGDDQHDEESPAEYEHWEYFVIEGAIARESFDVVR